MFFLGLVFGGVFLGKGFFGVGILGVVFAEVDFVGVALACVFFVALPSWLLFFGESLVFFLGLGFGRSFLVVFFRP